MTTYTSHPDQLFDPQKPILGSVGLQTRDNLIATAEGDPTAPSMLPNIAANTAYGALGTPVLARRVSGDASPGTRVAGSDLRSGGALRSINTFTNGTGDTLAVAEGGALSGTWECMGFHDASTTSGTPGSGTVGEGNGTTLWVRVLL